MSERPNLKLAAEGIVADYIGAPVKVITEAISGYRAGTYRGPVEGTKYTFDIMILIALFEALMPMIQNLIEQCDTNNRRRMVRRMQRPWRFQKRNFRQRCEVALAKKPDFIGDSREVADVALEYARYASYDSLRSVVNECRA